MRGVDVGDPRSNKLYPKGGPGVSSRPREDLDALFELVDDGSGNIDSEEGQEWKWANDTAIQGPKYVKLFVSFKTNEEMYNKLVEKFYTNTNVHELQIIEDPIDIKQSVRSDILDQGEDTMTFLNNYIDQIDTDLDRKKLKDFTKELYVEANE